MAKDKFRMYFLVMRNIGEKDKGIQCGHAMGEYLLMYFHNKEVQDFLIYDKTWIMLNGGVSNHETELFENIYSHTVIDAGGNIGSMEQHWNYIVTELPYLNVARFFEPDLNNALSAICFILPDRIFDKENFPDFKDWVKKFEENFESTDLGDISGDHLSFKEYSLVYSLEQKWINEFKFTEDELKLRQFISQFKLA
jgi:hypothetical protein